ncbi:hypothetical protein GCM10027174_10170 [Salinifilum aidingensis]
MCSLGQHTKPTAKRRFDTATAALLLLVGVAFVALWTFSAATVFGDPCTIIPNRAGCSSSERLPGALDVHGPPTRQPARRRQPRRYRLPPRRSPEPVGAKTSDPNNHRGTAGENPTGSARPRSISTGSAELGLRSARTLLTHISGPAGRPRDNHPTRARHP